MYRDHIIGSGLENRTLRRFSLTIFLGCAPPDTEQQRQFASQQARKPCSQRAKPAARRPYWQRFMWAADLIRVTRKLATIFWLRKCAGNNTIPVLSPLTQLIHKTLFRVSAPILYLSELA